VKRSTPGSSGEAIRLQSDLPNPAADRVSIEWRDFDAVMIEARFLSSLYFLKTDSRVGFEFNP
jgi:hypothetical protein